MARDYNAKGVIHYSLQFCQPYQMEAGKIVRELESIGVPALAIETDYSQDDAGPLKTRIEAFVELIK